MTKSADFGKYREDAYICRRGSNYRSIRVIGESEKFHYGTKGESLSVTRSHVRKNWTKLAIMNTGFMGRPWECACETVPLVEYAKEEIPVKSTATDVIHSVTVNGFAVKANVETLRAIFA